MISVIVPVYNRKETLERCVQSLRGQTYSDLEIILVDDGSTDGSGALCNALAREDVRIRVIHKENGGVSSARNAGIEAAPIVVALSMLSQYTQLLPDLKANKIADRLSPFFNLGYTSKFVEYLARRLQ